MRLLRKKDGSFEARFSKPDWNCFLTILNLYPRVPQTHHQLSRHPDNDSRLPGCQALLDEALAEQRATNKKAILRMFSDPNRLALSERGFSLRLDSSDILCLLQVLNDIRVGCWVALGWPEDIDIPESDEQQQVFYSMELAGHYEAVLIDAL